MTADRAYKLACKLKRRPSAAFVQAVRCGLHSGFPPCCIAFYVLFWQPLNDYDSHAILQDLTGQEPKRRVMGGNRYAKLLCQYAELLKGSEVEYIQCPACLLSGNAVEVKPCRCGRRR